MKTVSILVYRGKHDNDYYLVDTPERLQAAMRQLFMLLDECGCYTDEDTRHLAQARDGNIRAIKGILESHRCYEYEEWEIIEVIDPCTL